MKLVTVLSQNQERLGLEIEGKIFTFHDLNLQTKLSVPETMQAFLQSTDTNLPLAQKSEDWLKKNPAHTASEYTQKFSPVPHPTSCRDGYAFRQHVETMRRNRGVEMAPEFDLFPVFYFTNHNAVIGEGELIVHEDHLFQLDFELELAIVIGKKGRNIKAENADDYILGFSIMNDFSARKLQTEEMKLNLGPAKGKDFATAVGPFLLTKDELADRTVRTPKGNKYELEMIARHNGKQISLGNSGSMNWTFAQIIERASYGVDLYPGDIIGSGTVGTGCYAELNSTAARIAKENGETSQPVWLKDGDTIELEIEKLGVLANQVKKTEAGFSIL